MTKLSIIVAILACNQVLYDQLYVDIIQAALKKEVTRENMEKRNNAIEFLRNLCRGQRSSYEGEQK